MRARYDASLEFKAVYPFRNDGTCRCGCGDEVVAPRRFWSSDGCAARAVRYFRILKGDTKVIRRMLYARDGGRCAGCQRKCGRRHWEADHIIPVAHGGAGCELTNFQTLCRDCHRAKTNAQMTRARRRLLAKAVGEP